MTKKLLAVINVSVLILLIAWNYYSNTGAVNGETVSSLSDKYSSLFVPADYAFSIWGLIYFGLMVSAVYFLILAFGSTEKSACVSQAAPPLIAANLANGAWLWFWLNEQILVSVFMMGLVLFALIVAILRLNMEKWDAPVKFMALVWWPIDLYVGWISVAFTANVAAYLKFIGFSLFVGEEVWTIVVIGLSVALNVFMIYKRNMREFAAVGIWALIAIAIRHWMEIPSIGVTAAIGSIVLAVSSANHASKRKRTLPQNKIERGEI